MRGTARRACGISLIFAMSIGPTAAMAGVIAGSVKDGKTGEPLIGAAVGVVGTKLGAVTNLDGKYAIENVPAGMYSLRISYVGYAQKVITGVVVGGSETIQMPTQLEPTSTEHGDAMRIEDIYVTAERVRTSAASVLSERQHSSQIGDAISAEQIRLSPDGNSSDALRRVTGLSIVDDKFVFVRGVTDRYNATTLNGVAVTGTDTDSDKKSFNFDLMPASLIASTVVLKTATPDQPGDFSGGLVQVNTLDLPNDFMASASVDGSHDGMSTGSDIRVSPGGGKDWSAKDDGSRGLPPGLEGNELAKALPNTWGAPGDRSRMNQSYGLAIGDRYESSWGDFGFIASGTYKNSFKVESYHQNPFAVGEDGSRTEILLSDGTRYKHRFLWGGLLNLTYRPRGNHTFTIENNYTRSAEDKVTQAEGHTEIEPVATQTIEWDQRDLYLGQVAGVHEFPGLRKLQVEWRASYSRSEAQEPDRKFATYSPTATAGPILKENYRTWSRLGEDARGAKFDVSLPVGRARWKAGYQYGNRERAFDIQAFTTLTGGVSRQNSAILFLPIDEIFAAENYGTGKLSFAPFTDQTGAYDGTYDINAYYGMVDTPFDVMGRRFRFAGGARVEDAIQVVHSPISASSLELQTATIDERDVLPSANLTYQVTDESNVRLGYFKSVNRPEFREMANVTYIDFDKNQGVIGNPDLERALIDNYDIRLEWFPGIGEVVAVSYFYKTMTNAIEEQLLPSPGRYVRTWFNSPECKNYGYEIEVRKDLGFAWRHLENLIVQGNYTHVDSEVEYTESYNDPETNERVDVGKQRPMQGQAPYTVNAGLVYSLPDIGLSMSLLYNRFGRRLDAVGDTRAQDIYEESRDVLDFALTEQFYPWMRLKFTIKDMLADNVVESFGQSGSVWESTEAGTTYSVSLSFSL